MQKVFDLYIKVKGEKAGKCELKNSGDNSKQLTSPRSSLFAFVCILAFGV